MDAFESRKAELKGDVKDEHWFLPLHLYILPKLGCLPVSEITQTDIRNTLAIQTYKSRNSRESAKPS